LTFQVISFLIAMLLATGSVASEEASDIPAWTNQNIFRGSGLNGIEAKNPVPDLVGMNSAVKKFVIDDGWRNTGITANQDKLIKFDWSIDNITLQPRKYIAILRLDYRFDAQPMLIYSYNHKTNNYTADYLNYQGVDLTKPPTSSAQNIARIALLNQYASFINRGILLKSGDVLNIVLLNDASAIEKSMSDIELALPGNSTGDMSLYQLSSPLLSGMQNNAVVNMSADDLCRYTPNISNFSEVCLLQKDTNLYAYKPLTSIKNVASANFVLPANIPKCNTSISSEYWNLFTQALDEFSAKFNVNSSSATLDRWLDAANNHLRNYLKKGGDFNALYQNQDNLPKNLKSLAKDHYPYLYKWLLRDDSCVVDALATKVNYCLQDSGLGLQISVGSKIIKNENSSFIPVVDSDTNYVYTVKIQNSGQLRMSINPKFNPQSKNSFLDFEPRLSITDALGTGASYVDDLSMTGLQLGHYLMEISIGSDAASARSAISNLSYEYYIQSSQDPEPINSTTGFSMSAGNSQFDASTNGTIWVRVKNNTSNIDLNGDVNIKTTAYTGSQIISKGINNYIVKPILKRYANAMRAIYDGPTGLVRNFNIQNIVKAMAGLYIIIYAIYFLLGAVEMTTSDLLSRIVKVILVVNVLFSENSWQFFNDYLFSMMLGGTAQLVGIFANSSSSVSNPFSFLDPAFNTYISSKFWLAILAQLLQIWNGLGLLAMLVIASMTLFFATLLEITMAYILSLIVIHILIGLAPIFIPFMLFSSTKSFFTNWISVIFKNMLQPAILITMILIFDQFMSKILQQTVVANSWGCLQKFTISIKFMGLEWTPSDQGFCLPFFIPDISNSNVPVSKVSQTLNSLSGSEAAASTAAGLVLSYINVAMASFLYFTYTIVAKQLIGFTGDILEKITGISGSAALNTADKINSNSGIGQALRKFSGNNMMNRYVARRSPFNYEDRTNQKAWGLTGGALAKGLGKLRRGGKSSEDLNDKKPDAHEGSQNDQNNTSQNQPSQDSQNQNMRAGINGGSDQIPEPRKSIDDSRLYQDEKGNTRSNQWDELRKDISEHEEKQPRKSIDDSRLYQDEKGNTRSNQWDELRKDAIEGAKNNADNYRAKNKRTGISKDDFDRKMSSDSKGDFDIKEKRSSIASSDDVRSDKESNYLDRKDSAEKNTNALDLEDSKKNDFDSSKKVSKNDNTNHLDEKRKIINDQNEGESASKASSDKDK
jgi:type IV secretory pathway VirB6-like protein